MGVVWTDGPPPTQSTFPWAALVAGKIIARYRSWIEADDDRHDPEAPDVPESAEIEYLPEEAGAF